MYKTDKDRYNQLAKDWTHKYAMQSSAHDHLQTLLCQLLLAVSIVFFVVNSQFIASTLCVLLTHCVRLRLLGWCRSFSVQLLMFDCSNVTANCTLRSTLQAVVRQVIQIIESTFAMILLLCVYSNVSSQHSFLDSFTYCTYFCRECRNELRFFRYCC